MVKILNIDQIKDLNIYKDKIIVGGCFDIFHLGHAVFLEKAKSLGKTLIVLLESDKKVSELKGNNRPINNQNTRAELLIRLRSVDFVVKLDESNKNYENILRIINPKYIAITKSDKNFERKKLIADNISAKIIEIDELPSDFSSTKLIEKIKNNY